jgi:hypothetical protein
MLALALTLAAAAAVQPPPQPLDSPAQVRALCDALAPAERAAAPGDVVARGRAEVAHEERREALLDRTFRMTIPGDRLRFDRYDAAERRQPVRPAAGAVGRIEPVPGQAADYQGGRRRRGGS